MDFSRPSFATLIDRGYADFDAAGTGADARLDLSNINIAAMVHARAAHELHGHVAFWGEKILYDNLDGARQDRQFGAWGVTRKAATPATGNVAFAADAGSTIPAGTLLQRSDGAEYETLADANEAGGTVTVQVRALVAEAAGNTAASGAMALIAPVDGVTPDGAADAGGLSGGTDTESDADYFNRFALRLRQKPTGGAEIDYQIWTFDTPGVAATRVWVKRAYPGPGSVGITFVKDNDPVSILPTLAELDAVEAYMRHRYRRPAAADLYLFAPTAAALDPTILVTPDTADTQAAVTAALNAWLLRDGTLGGTLYRSRMREAISLAIGEERHELTDPAWESHTLGDTEIPVLGDVSWS